jgi:predicted transcriptional regulator
MDASTKQKVKDIKLDTNRLVERVIDQDQVPAGQIGLKDLDDTETQIKDIIGSFQLLLEAKKSLNVAARAKNVEQMRKFEEEAQRRLEALKVVMASATSSISHMALTRGLAGHDIERIIRVLNTCETELKNIPTKDGPTAVSEVETVYNQEIRPVIESWRILVPTAEGAAALTAARSESKLAPAFLVTQM